MATVILQYENLSANCIDEIDSTIRYLDNVINTLQSIGIPNDFSGKNELQNVLGNLRKERQILASVKTSIICSNNDYNRVVDNLLDCAKLLPVNKIEKRSSII